MSSNQDSKASNKKAPEAASSYKSLLSMDSSVTKKTSTMSKPSTSSDKSYRSRKRSRSQSRSRSRSPPPRSSKKEKKINYDIPDKSLGDFYCKACDSHMNSEEIWDMHIQGKRHLKNTKSSAEELESEKKYDYIDEDPEVLPVLNQAEEPIVGLQHVCEMQRIEQKPLYTCFLCNSTIPNATQLIDHLIGLKHRMAYLKEHEPVRYRLIHDSNLKKGQVEPVVEECVAAMEEKAGRGRMIVKRERSRTVNTWGVKKPEKDVVRISSSYREDVASDRKRSSMYRPERSIDYGHGENKYSSSYSERMREKEPERIREKEHERIREKEHEYDYRASIRNDDFRDRSSTSGFDRSVTSNNSGDLRAVLEKRKAPVSDSMIPDEILGTFMALPTVLFLQLVHFRLDSLIFQDQTEVTLLDRMVNKATTLAVNVKSKLLTPSLRMQFKESLAENGLKVERENQRASQATQNLFDLVKECKAMSYKEPVFRSSSPRESPSIVDYLSSPSQRSYAQPGPSSSHQLRPNSYSTQQPQNSYSTQQPQNSYSTAQQQNSYSVQQPQNSYSTAQQQNSYHAQQNPPMASRFSSSASYSSSYSSSCAIPGLTLAQDNHSPEKPVSPFDRLEARAKSLFGYLAQK